jgi:hypothetical protein
MLNKSEAKHLRAFNLLHTYLVDRGFLPKHQRLETTKPPLVLSLTFAKKVSIFSLCHHTTIAEMPPNSLFRRLRIISWPSSVEPTSYSLSTYGVTYSLKQQPRSIYCAPPTSTIAYPPRTSQRHLRFQPHAVSTVGRQAPRSSSTRPPNRAVPGHPMVLKAGTSVMLPSIIDVTGYTSHAQIKHASAVPWNSFPPSAICPAPLQRTMHYEPPLTSLLHAKIQHPLAQLPHWYYYKSRPYRN